MKTRKGNTKRKADTQHQPWEFREKQTHIYMNNPSTPIRTMCSNLDIFSNKERNTFQQNLRDTPYFLEKSKDGIVREYGYSSPIEKGNLIDKGFLKTVRAGNAMIEVGSRLQKDGHKTIGVMIDKSKQDSRKIKRYHTKITQAARNIDSYRHIEGRHGNGCDYKVFDTDKEDKLKIVELDFLFTTGFFPCDVPFFSPKFLLPKKSVETLLTYTSVW